MWLWEDFSSDSGVEDTPLLISARTQSLAISAIRQMQFLNQWDNEGAWDDIDAALASALTELMSVAMIDSVPVGTIVAFGNYNSVPAKWLYCNGALVAQATYPDLFALIGTIYGATSGGNFRLPELRQRMIYGALNAPSYEQGVFGGVEATALSISNMPAHSHVVPAHSHVIATAAGTGGQTTQVARGNSTTVLTQATDTEPATNTDSVGAGAAFNIMNPYLCVGYIIKALL
jgi:microcystin-dependent protein